MVEAQIGSVDGDALFLYYYFYNLPYYLHFVHSINFVKVTSLILFVGGFACFGAYIKGPPNE
jgi:hypothetical protein